MIVWLLHDDKAGNRVPCENLARALGSPWISKQVALRAPWSKLPPSLTPTSRAVVRDPAALTGVPDLVIACGRQSVAPALALKADGAKLVQLLNSRVSSDRFDLVIAPAHDGLAGENVISIKGSLSAPPTDCRSVLGQPLLACLIGGSSRHLRYDSQSINQVVTRLVQLRDWQLAGSFSRRSDPALKAEVSKVVPGLFDPAFSSQNPYQSLLAQAHGFLVTADSVNMISEAWSTGKPVEIIGPKMRMPAKFQRLYANLGLADAVLPDPSQALSMPISPSTELGEVADLVKQRLFLPR